MNMDQKPGPAYRENVEAGKEVYETMAETLREELVTIRKLVDELVEVSEVKTTWATQNRAELERLRRLSRQQLIDSSAEARKFKEHLEMILSQKPDAN
jgi:hypothetical protein